MTSPYVKDAAASTRTEQDARRDNARQAIRRYALRSGHDPDEAVAELDIAYLMDDLRKAGCR